MSPLKRSSSVPVSPPRRVKRGLVCSLQAGPGLALWPLWRTRSAVQGDGRGEVHRPVYMYIYIYRYTLWLCCAAAPNQRASISAHAGQTGHLIFLKKHWNNFDGHKSNCKRRYIIPLSVPLALIGYNQATSIWCSRGWEEPRTRASLFSCRWTLILVMVLYWYLTTYPTCRVKLDIAELSNQLK